MTTTGTVSTVEARAAIEALLHRGIDLEPVLRAAHLSLNVLTSVEARIPHENNRLLWEAAAAAARDPDFGAHVAETLPRGAFDVFDYLLSASATVGDSFARLARYSRLLNDHTTLLRVNEPGRVRVLRRISEPAPQSDEFLTSLLVSRSRYASGRDWTPERMRYQHQRLDPGGELERMFGCPVELGAPETEMWVAPSILRLPHTRSDSRLLAVLTRYADSLLETLPRGSDLVGSVTSLIARHMATGLPTLESVASALHTPGRTLQRRLADQGVTYSTLVDDVRRTLAFKYLFHAGTSLAEIGYILHFSDATAFHRAFKRWTGMTPARYRKELFEDPEHLHGARQ